MNVLSSHTCSRFTQEHGIYTSQTAAWSVYRCAWLCAETYKVITRYHWRKVINFLILRHQTNLTCYGYVPTHTLHGVLWLVDLYDSWIVSSNSKSIESDISNVLTEINSEQRPWVCLYFLLNGYIWANTNSHYISNIWLKTFPNRVRWDNVWLCDHYRMPETCAWLSLASAGAAL